MATIKFFLQRKKNPATVHLRLSISRDKVFRKATEFIIDPKNWSSATNFPKPNGEKMKKLKNDMGKLENRIEEEYNIAAGDQIEINGEWLKEQINSFHGTKKKTDPDRLINHFQTYIDSLPYKRDANRKKPVSGATIKKYTTIKNKILAFEKFSKKLAYIKDVDLKFRQDFIEYLRDVEKLSENTVGRYITFVKTICKDAKIYGIETSGQLDAIKGFTEEAKIIHFDFDEITRIENLEVDTDALKNTKDWLVIGCYIGQRGGDMLKLQKRNVTKRRDINLIELTQEKTGKQIFIPIHPKVKEILDNRNGEFPRKISTQKFNLHIKKIAKLAGINKPTEGSILNSETKRKESGIYPKWKLVTSHICRRSFASNYYGEMPTALIITITGHSTESQFLQYVNKPPIDHAEQIAEYLNSIYQKNLNNSQLKKNKIK